MEDNDSGETEVNLKYGDREKLKEKVIKMNKMLEHVKITGFTHCRNVIQAAMKFVGEEVGMNKSNAKKKKKPFWKRRILSGFSRLRKDLSRIEAWFTGRWKRDKSKEKELLDQKYGLRRKEFILVMEELKQRITAKASKVKRYDKTISEKQNTVKITKNDVTRKLKSMPDWKEEGTDKIQGFWLKSFTAVHAVLATVLNACTEVGDVLG